MYEVVLIHKQYNKLYNIITPLDYFDDIHSYSEFDNDIYYVNIGFLEDDEVDIIKTAIQDSGVIMKKIHYVLENDGTDFYEYLDNLNS